MRSITEKGNESRARQSKTRFWQQWPWLFFVRERFPPGNCKHPPTCFLFAEAHAAPQCIAPAAASAKSLPEPQAGALEILGRSDRRKNSMDAKPGHHPAF